MPILILYLDSVSLKAKNIIWERDILPQIWHLTLENQLKSAKYHIQISFLIILTSRISSSCPFISCQTEIGDKSHLLGRLRVKKLGFLEPSSMWEPHLSHITSYLVYSVGFVGPWTLPNDENSAGNTFLSKVYLAECSIEV